MSARLLNVHPWRLFVAHAVTTSTFVLMLGLASACSLKTAGIGRFAEADDDEATAPSSVRADASIADARVNDSASDEPAPDEVIETDSDADVKMAAPGVVVVGTSNDAGQLDAGTDTQNADSGQTTSPSDWPAISDPWQAGRYTPVARAGQNNATVFYPEQIGTTKSKCPIVIWNNAAGIYGPTAYRGLLEHMASHGFVVVAAYSSSVVATEILDNLTWILTENERDGSPYFQGLDETKIAAVGHALGSNATFAVASDARFATTIHLSGATHGSIGEGHATLDRMRHPAAFLCDASGGNNFPAGDPAASCQYDFDNAASPVFFATLSAGEQLNVPLNTRGAIVSWLRWHLMSDATMKPTFVGDSCTLCARTNWAVQQRDLDLLP